MYDVTYSSYCAYSTLLLYLGCYNNKDFVNKGFVNTDGRGRSDYRHRA